MWALYTWNQATWPKKKLAGQSESQDPQKGAHYEIFGDFQRNCPGGTNNVHKWPIFILGDLST